MVTGTQQQKSATKISASKLIDLLNERLSCEYDAIIMYGIYSQVANRAVYRNTAREVETHAQEKLQHALGISDQIHSLGGMAEIKIKPKLAHRLYNIEEVVCLELETNSEEIRSYQELVRQCETRNDFALAEQMRGILRNEQQHQMDQAAALAKDLTEVRIFL
jgi:bacterioferritin